MEAEFRIEVLCEVDRYGTGKTQVIERKWVWCGEGPFPSFRAALAFAEAEVGARWRIVAVTPLAEGGLEL